MRIVLDTNIVFSALLWNGIPYRLLTVIRQDSEARLFSSQTLVDELAEVLTRPAATKRLSVIGKTPHELLADYIETVELVEPRSVPRVVLADSDDDQVIAVAVAADADWIISGDADLLVLGEYKGLPILTAAQAIQQLSG